MFLKPGEKKNPYTYGDNKVDDHADVVPKWGRGIRDLHRSTLSLEGQQKQNFARYDADNKGRGSKHAKKEQAPARY